MSAGAGAVGGFRHRQAVGIVLDPHRPAEDALQVLQQRLAVEPRGIGVLDQASRGGEGPRDAEADGAGFADFCLGLPDQPCEETDGRPVVVAWRVGPPPKHEATFTVQYRHLGLGAPEVDAQAKGCSCYFIEFVSAHAESS